VPDAPLTIVLVDDADDVRSLLRTRLRLAGGFEVVGEGSNGREAVELVERLCPDLLLLDVSMPEVDGLEALSRLTAAATTTRVVMFSGFEEQGLADRALELGAADFVEKSVPVEELAERLCIAAGRTAPPEPRDPERADEEPEPVLAEHLERFRAAFEQAAIGMASLTLAGSIARANAALEGLASSGPGEMVGLDYHLLVDVHRRNRVHDVLQEVASGERDVATVEHDLRGRAVVSTAAVIRDSRKRPLYLFLQVQDVTERRAAEEELRRSEERFRLLVEGVRDYAIFMLDPNGNVASWNAGAQRFKGYTADEIVGRHFSTFYPEDAVAAGHPDYELEVAVAEGRYEEEGWRIRKDGTRFWANVVITAIRDAEDRLVGFTKVTRDVTERRELLDELAAAADERIQLLAVTAHELRTPVALVNGFTSTLRDHWDELADTERREMVAALARGGEKLGRLVEDLFTAARLESGALEVRTTPLDLTELVREVVRDLGAGEATVTVAEPAVVVADRGRVQQMLGNYLTNALRYGAPPITVEVRADGPERTATVVVTDAGPGVGPDLVDRLFTKFARGASREGTGLGLFIVRELGRAQGGDAWYEPAPGHGARFGFRLPLG
jgi:PAS domain S-box-containing protein